MSPKVNKTVQLKITLNSLPYPLPQKWEGGLHLNNMKDLVESDKSHEIQS